MSPSYALINHYKILSAEYVKSISGEDLFFLDLMALSVYNEHQKELMEKEKGKKTDEAAHPGLVRRLTPEEIMERQAKRRHDG